MNAKHRRLNVGQRVRVVHVALNTRVCVVGTRMCVPVCIYCPAFACMVADVFYCIACQKGSTASSSQRKYCIIATIVLQC